MSSGLDRVDRTDHQATWESLPWYVNGTLEGTELEQVEQHVQSCVACRAELSYLRELGALVHTAEQFPLTPAVGLAALIERIDRADSGAEAPFPRGIRSWMAPVYRASPGIRRALVAQAAAILLLLGLVAWTTGRQPAAVHHTLADVDAPVVDSRAHLRVVFLPDAPEARIREILGSVGGEIVSGPSALGVYTVAAPISGQPDETVASLLATLRAQPEITFAEQASR